jgi:adenosylcobyric acid synthase
VGQGILSDDGQITGCYLHGLFDQLEALQLFMRWLGHDLIKGTSVEELEEQAIERVSKAVRYI